MRRKGNAGWWSKLWSAPQSFKSCIKIPNNITAISTSGPVIARSAEQNKVCNGIFCTTTCSCPPRFSGIHRKSNLKLWSTLPKTLFQTALSEIKIYNLWGIDCRRLLIKKLGWNYFYLFVPFFNLFRILTSVKNISNINFTVFDSIDDFVLAS